MDLLAWSNLETSPIIIGVDEAGRGCLCGPVFAGAVSFKNKSKFKSVYKDSKLLTAEKREYFFEEILKSHFVGIGFATHVEVDRVNILQATFLAMQRAVLNLENILNQNESSLNNNTSDHQNLSRHILVDGNQRIPNLKNFDQTTVIKGDRLIPEISAASIVAKVSRDRYVDQLDLKYPEYEFSKHKGYGTETHRNKIKELGPCPEHRITFKGVREYLQVGQRLTP